MVKYGFFGGSFNPVTKAHVELAEEILEKYGLNKIIFVPVGDNYNKIGLVSEKHRYNMLKIAICKHDNLEVSNIELNQNKNLSTLEALNAIEKNYPNVDKYYIMGMDNLYKMLLSNDVKTLVKNYKYIIIERNLENGRDLINSNENFKNYKQNFKFMENYKHSKTSSTMVRKNLHKLELTNEIMDKEVLKYIESNCLYIESSII